MKGGTETEAMEECCFLASPLPAYSDCFLTHPKSICPRWHHLEPSLKKMPVQTHPQANLTEAIPQLRFLLPKFLQFMSRRQKLSCPLNCILVLIWSWLIDYAGWDPCGFNSLSSK